MRKRRKSWLKEKVKKTLLSKAKRLEKRVRPQIKIQKKMIRSREKIRIKTDRKIRRSKKARMGKPIVKKLIPGQ